jgi:FkbM family methyltransferase
VIGSLKSRVHRLRQGYLDAPLRWRYVKWPAPRWQAQRFARLEIGGYPFKFFDPMSRRDFWWSWEVWFGVWEPAVARFLAATLSPGATFVDVGAYIGPYALLASRLVGPEGVVCAFEPDPVARRGLERNLRANAASNVEVLSHALSDRAGSEWLSEAGDDRLLGNSESMLSPEGGTLRVPTVTLDNFCRERGIRPDVVKIDVEGAEARVVAGGRATLAAASAVLVEFHDDKLVAQGGDPALFMARLFELADVVTVLDVRKDPSRRPTELRPGAIPTGNVMLAFHPPRS